MNFGVFSVWEMSRRHTQRLTYRDVFENIEEDDVFQDADFIDVAFIPNADFLDEIGSEVDTGKKAIYIC